jgi:sugar transport system substrate-binding protein
MKAGRMGMKTRRVLLPVVATLTAVTVAACGSGGSSPAAGSSSKIKTIGVVLQFNHVAFTDFEKGLRELGEAKGIDFKIVNSNLDAAKEAQFVTDLITAHVDAIVIAPVAELAASGPVARASKQGIPVFGFTSCSDSDISREYLKTCLGSNEVELGQLVGKSLAEYADGRTLKVGELTCNGYAACRSRHDGFMKGLGSTKIDIVDAQEGFYLADAAPVASTMLTANPDLDVILAQNEDGVVAAAQAVKARGLAGKVAVFGVGMDPRIAPLMLSDDGIIKFTAGQDFITLGKIAMQTVLDYADGKDVPFSTFSPSTPFAADDKAAVQKYLDAHPTK